MAELSLMAPPDGDRSKSGTLISVTIVFTVVAALVVWLRIYVRIYMTRQTWYDDWMMFVASLIMIVDNAFLITSYKHGVGRHIYYLSASQIETSFKWLWAAEPTNLFAVYLVRVSVSLFFLRIVPQMRKSYRLLIWMTIVLMTIADLYVSINYFIQCRPIQKVWKPEIEGTCLTGALYAVAPWLYQGISIVCDIAIMVVPILLFRHLQVDLRTKIALMAIFSLGIFTTVCAVVKTALLTNLFSDDPDHSWKMGELCLWASLECCVGMICGSIPALKPIFSMFAEKSESAGSNDNVARLTIGGGYRNRKIHQETCTAASEEEMVPIPRESDGIWQTTEVQIKRENTTHKDIMGPKTYQWESL